VNSQYPPVLKQISFLLILVIVTGLTTCSHRHEHEQFQALSTIDSDSSRLQATLDFLRQYPESDSLQPAIESALALWNKYGQSDEKCFFTLKQRLMVHSPEIRNYLDSLLINILATDSAGIRQLNHQKKIYQEIYPDPLGIALVVFPYLSTCFQSDSLRNRSLENYADVIIRPDYHQVDTLKQFSDQILSLHDQRLIPLSNRFLIHGIRQNRYLAISDSARNQTYYTLYTALAWNAYRQQRYSYALNLISQASKYGNPDNQNGNIILGAAQAQCGELNAGWARILRGLILNPEAEKKSPEINQIYTEMFRKIRGSHENPVRFLSQYRRSHR